MSRHSTGTGEGWLATPRLLVDVPLALTIVGLGVLIVLAPGSVPGLTPAM
jgi:hypothetical protein